MRPEISVIMPVYNGEKYLKYSIESILNQTFQDFEFLIINDCSTDGSLAIIQDYAKTEERMIVLSNPENLGLPKSLNKGLQKSTGKYIARQDADDISESNRLTLQYSLLEKDDSLVMIGSNARYIDENGSTIKTSPIPQQKNEIITTITITKGLAFFHGSLMFRGKAIRNAGGYREIFPSGEDKDIVLRMSEFGEIRNLSDILYHYRIHSGAFTSQSKLPRKVLGQYIISYFYQRKKKGIDDTGLYLEGRYNVEGNRNRKIKSMNRFHESAKSLEKRKIGSFFSNFVIGFFLYPLSKITFAQMKLLIYQFFRIVGKYIDGRFNS